MQGPEGLGLRDGLGEVGQLSASQVLGPPSPSSPGALALVSAGLRARLFSSPPRQLPCSLLAAPAPPSPVSSAQQLEESFGSSRDHITAPLVPSLLAFPGSEEKIQAFCDPQGLAHLFSGPRPSHSASFMPPACSPPAELLHVCSV